MAQAEAKGIESSKWTLDKRNKEKEKQLYWQRNSGFRSDDSDDEEFKFKRFQKFYNEDKIKQHGTKPYYVSRVIQPFELLLINELGGS